MSIEIVTKQPPEDPKYVEEMAAKGRAARTGEPPENPPADPAPSEGDASDRPEWLPEKFKSPEDLAKAYAALEAKLGKQGEKPKDDAEAAPKDDAEAAHKDENGLSIEQQEQLSKGNVDMSALRQEFREKGELSDETYAKLESVGFTRDDVNAYIEGQKAVVERIRQGAFELVGGEETFTAMQEWARANLNEQEIAAFNRMVSQGDTRDTAILGLYTKYTRAVGVEPKSNVSGGAPGAGDIYDSRHQLTKDMSSEEYQKDPAFRNKVAEKLARTKKAGKNIWQ